MLDPMKSSRDVADPSKPHDTPAPAGWRKRTSSSEDDLVPITVTEPVRVSVQQQEPSQPLPTRNYFALTDNRMCKTGRRKP
jgi:hypothetical protein